MPPPKPDPMVSCKDVDDDAKDFRHDVTSQVLDNEYESIRDLQSFRVAKTSSKPRTESTGSCATEEKTPAMPPDSEKAKPGLNEDIPSGSTNGNGSNKPATSPNDDQHYPPAFPKHGKGKRNTSHRRTISADVHLPFSTPYINVGPGPVQDVRRDELGYMIPGTHFEDKYTPLKCQSATTSSLTHGSPRTDDNAAGSDDEDDEHDYLVPDIEEDTPPMSPSAGSSGYNKQDSPFDPSYEQAIHKTHPISRRVTSEGPSGSYPTSDQVYESIPTGPAPPTGSHVFHTTSNDPFQEQYYEESLDIEPGLQPTGHRTHHAASHGVSSADRKASGSIDGSSDNFYEAPM